MHADNPLQGHRVGAEAHGCKHLSEAATNKCGIMSALSFLVEISTQRMQG
jgi:hypothetical protein